jgi:hypothetical protein
VPVLLSALLPQPVIIPAAITAAIIIPINLFFIIHILAFSFAVLKVMIPRAVRIHAECFGLS